MYSRAGELKYSLVCVIARVHAAASSGTAGPCSCDQLTSEVQCFTRCTYQR